MRKHLTHIPFFPTLARYVRILGKDVSFTLSARMLVRLLIVAAGLFLLLGVAGRWADVYNTHDASTQDWKQYLFCILGSIDAKPEADAGSVLYSAFVRLAGAIVVGGVITSFFCALAERIAEMKLRGLLVPVMRDHFVVVGYGAMTDDLVRDLLAPESRANDLARWLPHDRPDEADWKQEVARRKVLLCTGGDVEKIRETIEAVLPREVSSRIVYAFGDMNLCSGRDAVCERLCLEDARQIYILGDDAALSVGDVENLAFAQGVGDYLGGRLPKHGAEAPTPIFVRLDGAASFDFVKKLNFKTHATEENAIGAVRSFFKPFSFTEGWARRIWGDATASVADAPEAATDAGVLDFADMTTGMSVHLVVAGLTPMGEALVLQAVRVCHFPNGRQTLVTVIDPDMDAENAFFSRHPSLRGSLVDVRIEFLAGRIESEPARRLLRDAAMDKRRLLSVAVCFRHSDAALSAALNLPEEVYWHRLEGGKRNVRATYRENGPRIWVFQEHRDSLSERAWSHPRYGNLRSFGMQESGFTPWCLREFCAMYLNAVYDWPNEAGAPSWLDGCSVPSAAGRIAAFREKWSKELSPDNPYGVFAIDATEKKNLLLAVLSCGGDPEVRRFQEYAFRKYVLLKPDLRWANHYVSDSYGAVLRALGLRAVYDRGAPFAELVRENDRVFAEARQSSHFVRSLAETEHNRWMADRALMGYRAPRPGTGEKRDDDFRYHNDMIPFSALPASEQGKDELSIASIPLFMALEGIRLGKAEGLNPSESRSSCS